MRKSSRNPLSLIISLVLIAGFLLVWSSRQRVYDWVQLRNYQPPAQISQLADQTTMNDKGRRIFYVQHPDLEAKTILRQNCTIFEQSIVLGCYAKNKGIYILDVTDSRLEGVEQVTAAHEMLHAAYDRLSSKEKARINSLLDQAYSQLNDERVKKVIEQYRSQDPSIVPNEMHSIFGTEVANLPPELETYYQQYFSNRRAIVNFSEHYEQAFTDRKNKVDQYDKQLNAQRAEIEQSQKNQELELQALQSERDRLDKLLEQKQFDSYNAGVESFNQSIRDYNSSASSLQQKITQYNQLLNQRNSIALETQELFQAIDTRVNTQAEQ